MSNEPQIIILRENFIQSAASDTFTFVVVLSLIGIGYSLGSEVLQFFGAIMAMIVIVSKAYNRDKKLTIAQARKLLDEIEGKA